VGVDRGLSSNCDNVLQLSAVEFAKMVETAVAERRMRLQTNWTDEPPAPHQPWFDCHSASNVPADIQAASTD
jgi:hypothetical protein